MRTGSNNAVRSFIGHHYARYRALSAIGVGRLFGGAIDSATEFESKLSSIRAVTGASSEQLARMKKAAEDATKTTTFSASQAADALGELARARGDADAAIAQLAPTLTARCRHRHVEAALILTTTLTQFGLGADQATRAADLFSREANSTNDTVEKLGLAMSYVAPLARQLGLSLEETTAIIGAMAQEGFRGERAGTALRNVFSALLDPSSKFREELRGLGINSKNFTEIITQLAAAGDKGKRALLALDAEATPAIQALVTSGGANIKRLLGDFENVNGEVERTARTMGDNFGGATARLSSAFDQLRRALIEPILDPLKVQFDDVANRIRAFIQTAEFDRIIESVKRFAIDATDALIALGRGVDYNELSNRIREFTRDASTFFTDLKENVQGVLSAISIASGTISTIFNGAQTVILGAATAVTGAMSIFVRSIRAAVEAMSALPGGAEQFRGVAERLTKVIGGLDAVATEFAKRTAKNAGETADAFNGLSAAVDD
ncbi:MAG: phage tail tape measure protein, partial [Anaerolineae bacterium]|nr:phage tail tape measure protein [Anaerolineae bacterium]